MFESFKIKFEKGKKGLWMACYNSTPFRRNAIYSLRQCGSRQKNTGSISALPRGPDHHSSVFLSPFAL